MKKSMKRALSMFVVFCMLVVSIPQVIFASDYENHWAKEAIEKWSEKGIVVGYEDGTFRPSNEITRGELSAILVRVFNLSDTTNAKEYEDVAANKWYAGSIAIASSAKLMHEEGDKFRPDDPATREEAAYAIAKAYKISGAIYNEFTDQASISSWASDSVSALAEKGFLNGYPDGSFGPKRTLSRAEVVAMLDKATGEFINAAGTYTDDVNGNLIVNTRDVILKDMTITGNLYLTEGIGDGDITLENITVEGETFVNGGGLNSIKSKDSKFLQSMKVSAKNPVRLVIVGDAVKIEAFPGTTVTLTGNFSDVILPPGVNVTIKDATVGKIFIEPGFAEDKDLSKALIKIEEGATVKNIQADAPVETKGKGKIENLVVNSDGVKTEQEPTKTEIKDEDIKVDIAGKEETKETIEAEKPKTPSTGGGGGGGNSSESTPSKYRISGKVTYDGKGLEGVHVNIWAQGTNQFDAYVQTDENGNYTFYVPSKHTYQIGASFVDEERYGYEKAVSDVVANSNKSIDIKLERVYVANIQVFDNKGKVVTSGVEVREIDVGNWYTDTEGYATIFFWNKDDSDREFDFYIDGMLVGNLTGVKRGEDFKTDYKVKLDVGLGDKISGKAVFENGSPAIGVPVYLYKIVPINTQESEWSEVDYTKADDDGQYNFSIPEDGYDYAINSYYEEGENAYISKDLDALIASKEDLLIRQSYTITVNITDQAGKGLGGDNVEVEVKDTQGRWYRTNVGSNGISFIYYYQLVPGDYHVTVTVDGQAIVRDITINEDEYNYSLDFKFEYERQKTLTVNLTNGSTLIVGDEKVEIESVMTLGGRYPLWADFDKDGKATLNIPEDFDEGMEIWVWFEGDIDSPVFIKYHFLTYGNEVKIDVEDIDRLVLDVDMEITTTTGPAIELSTPSSITLKLGSKDFHKEVATRDIDKNLEIDNLINGPYTLTIKYKIDGVEYKSDIEFALEIDSEDGCIIYEPGSERKELTEPIVLEKEGHKLAIKLGLSKQE